MVQPLVKSSHRNVSERCSSSSSRTTKTIEVSRSATKVQFTTILLLDPTRHLATDLSPISWAPMKTGATVDTKVVVTADRECSIVAAQWSVVPIR